MIEDPAMSIRYYEKGSSCRAIVDMMCEAHAELSNADFSAGNMPPRPEKVTAAYDRGELVGFISFYLHAEGTEVWINMGYVTPRCRHKKIYTQLWNALVSWARKNRVFEINSYAHVDNKKIQEIMKKQERKAQYIQYCFKIGEVDYETL